MNLLGPFTQPLKYEAISGVGFYFLPCSDDAPAGWGEPYEDSNENPINPPWGTVGGERAIHKLIDNDGWDIERSPLTKMVRVNWNDGDLQSISWNGPFNRYWHPVDKDQVWSNLLYVNGVEMEVCSSPEVVMGACWRDDFIFFVTYHTGTQRDTLYKRQLDSNIYPYHKINNPKGTRKIIEWAPSPVTKYSQDRGDGYGGVGHPWFFNKSGTEAQCIRRGWNTTWTCYQYWRLKLTLTTAEEITMDTPETVTFQEFQEPLFVRQHTRTYDRSQSQTPLEGWTLWSAEYHETISRTDTGAFAVAVDYKEDTEVIARLSWAAGAYFDSTDAVNNQDSYEKQPSKRFNQVEFGGPPYFNYQVTPYAWGHTRSYGTYRAINRQLVLDTGAFVWPVSQELVEAGRNATEVTHNYDSDSIVVSESTAGPDGVVPQDSDAYSQHYAPNTAIQNDPYDVDFDYRQGRILFMDLRYDELVLLQTIMTYQGAGQPGSYTAEGTPTLQITDQSIWEVPLQKEFHIVRFSGDTVETVWTYGHTSAVLKAQVTWNNSVLPLYDVGLQNEIHITEGPESTEYSNTGFAWEVFNVWDGASQAGEWFVYPDNIGLMPEASGEMPGGAAAIPTDVLLSFRVAARRVSSSDPTELASVEYVNYFTGRNLDFLNVPGANPRFYPSIAPAEF